MPASGLQAAARLLGVQVQRRDSVHRFFLPPRHVDARAANLLIRLRSQVALRAIEYGHLRSDLHDGRSAAFDAAGKAGAPGRAAAGEYLGTEGIARHSHLFARFLRIQARQQHIRILRHSHVEGLPQRQHADFTKQRKGGREETQQQCG